MPIAVDFETSYSAARDIRSMGVTPYLRHPETSIYLVSIVGEGIEYAGSPETAPWEHAAAAGMWLSHNAAFDRAVYTELRRRQPGRFPAPPAEWNCTSDMAAALQVKRDLASAAKILNGSSISKKIRKEMKGVSFHELDAGRRAEVEKYALDDSRHCLDLWTRHSHLWPEFERRLSRSTADMVLRGIAVDAPRVAEGIETLANQLYEVEKLIPWAGELDEKGDAIPVSSSLRIAAECRRIGIPVPKSTDVKSYLFEAWEAEYAEMAPFVGAIQRWRKINRVLATLRSIQTRTIDGICYYELKYGGAPHTLRWSGGNDYESKTETSAMLNMQNLSREPVEGVDLRGMFVARPGHRLVVSDLSQIEARVVLWLAGDEKVLAPLRAGADLYDSYARSAMGYSDPRPLKEADPKRRQLAKTHWLGLGYGMSADKLRDTARKHNMRMTAEEAEATVAMFRLGNPRIHKILWKPLDDALRRHAVDGILEIELPSRRRIRYYDVRRGGFGYSGVVERGGKERNLWYGLMTENLVQGTARDVFGSRILALEDAGFPVVLHVHDEAVNEVPEAGVEESAREINRIMSTAPEWAAGLPVASGTDVMERYAKK